jgi:hypothetical protein
MPGDMNAPTDDKTLVMVTGLEVHSNAARFFVELSQQLDQADGYDATFHQRLKFSTDPLQSAALAAVLNSCSAIEALLNELYLCDSEGLFIVFQGLQKAHAEKLGRAWNAGAERLSIKEKVDLALTLTDAKPLNWGTAIPQRVTLLLRLRNELVHHKARWIDQSRTNAASEDSLERQLHNQFEPAQVPAYGNPPFRWSRCLGSGCATWAWTTARTFINDIAARMQLGMVPMHF